MNIRVLTCPSASSILNLRVQPLLSSSVVDFELPVHSALLDIRLGGEKGGKPRWESEIKSEQPAAAEARRLPQRPVAWRFASITIRKPTSLTFTGTASQRRRSTKSCASGDDYPAARNSRMKLGQTLAGRHLQVIYVPDENPDSVFVITAYELRGKAKKAYRRRRRRRPR